MNKLEFEKLVYSRLTTADKIAPDEEVIRLSDIIAIAGAAADGMRTKLVELMKRRGSPIPQASRDTSGDWKKKTILEAFK